jgi:hypothetical protein
MLQDTLPVRSTPSYSQILSDLLEKENSGSVVPSNTIFNATYGQKSNCHFCTNQLQRNFLS